MASAPDVTTDLTTAITESLSIAENNLHELMKKQGDFVRKLKAEKASKEQVCLSIFLVQTKNSFEKIDAAVAKLLDLKQQIAALQGTDGEEGPGGEKLLKTPRVNHPTRHT